MVGLDSSSSCKLFENYVIKSDIHQSMIGSSKCSIHRTFSVGFLSRRCMIAIIMNSMVNPIRHYALVRVSGLGGEWDHEIFSKGLSGGLLATQRHG